MVFPKLKLISTKPKKERKEKKKMYKSQVYVGQAIQP